MPVQIQLIRLKLVWSNLIYGQTIEAQMVAGLVVSAAIDQLQHYAWGIHQQKIV